MPDGTDSRWLSLARWLYDQLINHAILFFPMHAKNLFIETEILFLPLAGCCRIRRPAICIPIDVPAPLFPDPPYAVPFNGTELTLWNRLPKPSGLGWACLPDDNHPLWYFHRSGAVVPAYNMFCNVTDLLTLREERELRGSDKFGRFPPEASPRWKAELLEVPVFNEATAAIAAACVGLHETGRPIFDLGHNDLKVYISLSHDCDILRGNDAITQVVRAYRVLRPLLKRKPPHLKNFWWIIRNAFRPKDFYFEDAIKIIEIEREFDFTSSFYMLNGSKGRYGARSGSSLIPAICNAIPKEWPVGIHYNYDTFLDDKIFEQQKQDLETILGGKVQSGRAHYLRFDPTKSWSFLGRHGICFDETVGFPRVGYRCGIAGLFQPFDIHAQKKVHLWEIPLVVMDSALVQQYPRDPIGNCDRLLAHLSRVGGALGVLWHPGQFDNPEFPEFIGLYRLLLETCKKYNANGLAASQLVQKLASKRPLQSTKCR